MTRVRGFTQDDAHLFCTEEQVAPELLGCLELVKIILGTLDMKDAYAGEWFGTPSEEGKATTLVNDGRRVLGIHFQQGAIVDRFALVVEEKAK